MLDEEYECRNFLFMGDLYRVWYQTHNEYYKNWDKPNDVFIIYNNNSPVKPSNIDIPNIVRQALTIYVTNGGVSDLTIEEYLDGLDLAAS